MKKELLLNVVGRVINNKLMNEDLQNVVINSMVEYDFNVGDIESGLDENGEWVLKLIKYTDGKHVYTFDDIEECHEHLKAQDNPIYFHNLDFDVLFFMQNSKIMSRVENEPIISAGNKIISVALDGVIFKNSLTLLPMGLKAVVSKYLKINDKEYLEDKSNVMTLDPETLDNYCFKDVLYLMAALQKANKYFIKNYQTKLALTTPALAYKVYTKHFLDDPDFLSIPRRHKFFDENYYYGGHTEKFVAGKKVFRSIRYFDVNSLYPRIMRDIVFPNCKLHRTHPTIPNLKRLLGADILFYGEFIVNIDSENLRHFPSLDKKTKSNKYLYGLQTIKMSELGIKFILKYGSWKNIISVNTLLTGSNKSTISPFKRWVQTFYALRKTDTANDVFIKLLLNALYGKFGQKVERIAKYLNVTEPMDTMPDSVVMFNKKNAVIESHKETTPYYMLGKHRQDIAGKITEGARLYMGDIINRVRDYGKVVYMDTDSLMTEVNLHEIPEFKGLLDDNELGKLSDEIGYKDSAIILGQKMYHFYKSGKKATKGVKKMNLDDFRGVIRGKKDFRNTRFTKLHSLVNQGFFGLQEVPYQIKHITERLD